ncbi:hypothetical protein PoMZ_03493 [Pyricularia oryzae]|uniref:Uncharacterized protein n=1 Tax=Pyricularia oryzae TaxID=318829 RepID=A0A4P7N7W0_PYROR|nr:hypothetical protein PoMZ_03493 [Pyricularia oryzae]
MHGAETAVTACVKVSTNNTTEPSRNWHTILRWYQWKRTFSVIVLVIPGQRHRVPVALAGMAGLDSGRNMNLTKCAALVLGMEHWRAGIGLLQLQ